MAERIDELSPISSISGTDIIIVDDGATTQSGTIAQVTEGLTYATEAEARAGTKTGVVMDPLQVANAIDELAPSGDVVGPSSSTNGAVALFDGTTGKLLEVGPEIAAGGSAGLLRADGDGSSLTGIDAGLPVGTPFYWLADTPPSWALELDGSEISRTTYADLFAILGTTFGSGDGSTTFNLPDDRGNAIRGWDNGRGVDSGRVFGSEQLDQMQQITGTLGIRGSNTGFQNDTTATGAFSVVDAGTIGLTPSTTSASSGLMGFDSGNSSGARVGDETRMRNRAYLPCIVY